MKTKLFQVLSLLLLFAAGLVSACHKPETDNKPVEHDTTVYPIVISFTEYSLEGSTCQWQSLPYDEKVILINNSEDLEKYISCIGKNYPAIDFSKHSLLLVSGSVNNRVAEIAVNNLKQTSSHEYTLSIEIDLKYKDTTDTWNIALQIEKISDVSNIELNLTLKSPKTILPITIIDESMIAFFVNAVPTCFFTNLGTYEDTCIVINNAYEFQQSYTCTHNLPEIDFDKFTLIIGKKWIPSTNITIIHKIIEDTTLTFVLTMIRTGFGSFPTISVRYYWGLYPKLPNKSFHVEYKFYESK